MSSRVYSASVYRGLKSATRRLVQSFGPLKCAVAETRITLPNILQRFYSQNDDDATRFMPVDVALDLMTASGDVGLLSYLADQLGYDLVAQPDCNGCVMSRTTDQIAKGGNVISKLAVAISDGKITAEEIRENDLIAQMESVINGASVLKSHFRDVCKRGEETSGGGDD